MKSIVLNSLREKFRDINVYGEYMREVNTYINSLTSISGDTYVDKIKKGEMTLDEYIEFKSKFMQRALILDDYRRLLVELISLSTILELSLVKEGKTLADELNLSEMSIINSARQQQLSTTFADKDKVSFKKEDDRILMLKQISENAKEEYESVINSTKK